MDRRIIKNLTKKEKTVLTVAAGVFVIAIIVAVVVGMNKKEDIKEDKDDKEVVVQESEQEAEDIPEEKQPESKPEPEAELDDVPQDSVEQNKPEGDGVSVDIATVVDENETKETTVGIDVSKYQGTIAWKKVAESGIDFVMVRVGYRSMADGAILPDSNAKYNMQEAQKYGIKVGAYFFSTATSDEEAIEEANWVADYISKYKITYPVAYNCEGFNEEESRQFSMTKTERTDVALAFLKRIAERGYSPMFYAAKGEMEGDVEWETSRIASLYKVWVAQYPSVPYPQTTSSSYSGVHAMWQYTNKGEVSGIGTSVDVNIAYFGYEEERNAQSTDAPENVDADPEALMEFTNIEETVTAKDKTNLRDKPSQSDDSKVLYTLTNGEKAIRTGISNSGWSRVVFDGKTYYAVSSYLTTDLSYKPPEEEPDDGIKTEFTAANEIVTAKDVVNLRQKPSVDDSIAPVMEQLKKGETAVRTGINYEVGWSRVEYNGKTLYCVSSYLETVE